jgi:DNA polymerase-3 subunit alpha
MNGEADARRLQQVLAPYRASGGGACPVVVAYRNAAAACEIALGERWRVRPEGALLAELGAWLTPENVQLIYGAAGS